MNPESKKSAGARSQSNSVLSDNSRLSNLIPLDFKQVPMCHNLCRLHKIYGPDEYALFCLSVITGLGFIFVSFAYYISKYHDTASDEWLLWFIFIIGVMFKTFTVICVARFIELIFHGFQIYYDHMKDLAEEIEFEPDHEYKDKSINAHYVEIKPSLKPYEKIRKPTYNIDNAQNANFIRSVSNQTSFLIASMNKERDAPQIDERKYNEDENEQDIKVELSMGDQWAIWFENWCRIEMLSSRYFHNRQNIVFGIVGCTLIAVTVTFYQIFVWDTLVDELNLSCFCGLGYVIIVVVRFIMWSLKFSKLETKHVRLIRIQKMYINHKRILLSKKLTGHDKNNQVLMPKLSEESVDLNSKLWEDDEIKNHPQIRDKIGEYDGICKQLDDVIKRIEDRSLCPKIAGLTLNKAFMNLTITSILGYVFAWALYKLRQDYIDEK